MPRWRRGVRALELNRSLDDVLDDAQFRDRIRASTRQLHALASEIMASAVAEHPELAGGALAGGALRRLLDAADHPLAPLAAAPLLSVFSAQAAACTAS